MEHERNEENTTDPTIVWITNCKKDVKWLPSELFNFCPIYDDLWFLYFRGKFKSRRRTATIRIDIR